MSVLQKLILLLAMVQLSQSTVMAAVANPNLIAVSQSDGTVLTIRQHGDEYFSWVATDDGYRVVKNKDGIYEYATQLKSGIVVPSGVKAHDEIARSSGEKAYIGSLSTHLGVTSSEINQNHLKSQSPLKSSASAGYFPSFGNRKLLVILVNFDNTTATYTQTDFNNLMNLTNYNGSGSFNDYYREVSNTANPLNIAATVTDWVTVSKTHDYYDLNVGELVLSAIQKAADAAVNFDAYDNDGNGVVESVMIVHQGSGQEWSTNTSDIWSHYYSLSSYGYDQGARTIGGKTFDQYVIVPETNGTGTAITPIGIMCHEFGHALGMADYYDTDDTSGGYTGTGTWDLMANGMWNVNNGVIPAHPNPYEKIKLGWAIETELTTQGTYSLSPVLTGKTVYRINSPDASEYFLLENRIKSNFDYGIQGEGMLIYHVDEDVLTTTGNSGTPLGLAILPAYGGVNSVNCTYPGVSKTISFTDDTYSNSKTWAGTSTQKPLSNIQLTSTSDVLFDFMTSLAEPVIINSSIANQVVSLKWNPVVDETFDGYETKTLSIPNWTFYDGDNGATYNIKVTIDNVKTTVVPSYTGAFTVLPSYTGTVFTPYLGSQFIGCVSSKTPPNNDWLISPVVKIQGSNWLSFYARTFIMANGIYDKFNVLISETGSSLPSDFVNISSITSTPIEAPVNWTEYKYDLSAYNGKEIRFAIQCVSNDAYMFMLDFIRLTASEPGVISLKSASLAQGDFERTSEQTSLALKSASSHVDNIAYNVYRDDELISTQWGMSNTSFTETVGCSAHDYKVEAVRTSPSASSVSANVNIKACNRVSISVENNSNPVVGASVSLYGVTLQTDEFGIVRFDNIPNGDYVVEISGPGYQTKSLPVAVTSDYSTSVEMDITLSAIDDVGVQFSLYPNPTHDEVHISTNLHLEDVKYEIRNLTGSVLLKGILNDKASISLQSLPAGVYFLDFFEKQIISSHKITKF